MINEPLKKFKVIDIVRKNQAPIEKKEALEKNDIEGGVRPNMVHPLFTRRVSERSNTIQKETVLHQADEKPHMIEVPAMEAEERKPLAYIPKEEPSRAERKALERAERRERKYEERPQRARRYGVIGWLAACLLLGIAAYVAVGVLPRASIVLAPKVIEWPKDQSYQNTITANEKIADIDAINRQVPVAVFSEKKSNAFTFPATGSGKNIERKASGMVTIYNSYSSAQQPLIAGTRLQAPDGKLFRLKSRVIIPGMQGSTPGSVDAEVTADQYGESYNIGPVAKFTIPGFQGTAKYEKFYAISNNPMSGGFVGEGKFPTAQDIAAAKASAEKQMQDAIDAFLSTQIVPNEFKILESSKKFAITKEVVNKDVDEQNNFTVYIEANESIDAVKEEQVLKLMTVLFQQTMENGNEYQLKEYALSYGDMSADQKTGVVSLQINFKGTFWKPVDVVDFKNKVMGKKEDELKSFVFSSTNIGKADVSLWPFWVRTVPSDPNRVKVELK